MTLITSSRNADDLSMTLVAEFDAAPERLWNLWEDPRRLERWWGPPGYPATFPRYEFAVGGQCRHSVDCDWFECSLGLQRAENSRVPELVDCNSPE